MKSANWLGEYFSKNHRGGPSGWVVSGSSSFGSSSGSLIYSKSPHGRRAEGVIIPGSVIVLGRGSVDFAATAWCGERTQSGRHAMNPIPSKKKIAYPRSK